jgi:hypothetical protein
MLDISKWTDTLRMAHVEDGCLGCVRRVLQAEGWPARSWQQDGLLVEDEGCAKEHVPPGHWVGVINCGHMGDKQRTSSQSRKG